MQARETAIEGLLVIATRTAEDERGALREYFRSSAYGALSPCSFAGCVQVNVTYSRRGVIRGMHGEETTKLVGVVAGEAFGAYVDARPESPTFGAVETLGLVLGSQVLVPPGVLNGFQALSKEGCQYLYGFDHEWSPEMPLVAASALDAELAIPWPIPVDPADRSLISARDAALPPFSSLAAGGDDRGEEPEPAPPVRSSAQDAT